MCDIERLLFFYHTNYPSSYTLKKFNSNNNKNKEFVHKLNKKYGKNNIKTNKNNKIIYMNRKAN